MNQSKPIIRDVMILRYRHCKACRFCDPGIVEFLKNKGIDYIDFLMNGVPEDVAVSWNDTLVNRVIAFARQEAQGA